MKTKSTLVSIEKLVSNNETPFMVLDLQKAEYQYKALQAALPGVKLFYALKALAHPELIKRLWKLGSGFDISSNREVDLVEGLGIVGDHCIHTHPIKKDDEINRAMRYGCNRFVIDNMDELEKFAPYAGRVQLTVRVNFHNPHAMIDFSYKFGAKLTELLCLVFKAQDYGLHIVGLSFHIGSQSLSPAAHVEAIKYCLHFMKQSAHIPNVNWLILDIGGGFPIQYQDEVSSIEEYCAPIMEALKEAPPGLEIYAEPGRFIAAPSMFEVVKIIGKAKRNAKTWYYMDDGVYGGFSGQIFDSVKYPIEPLKPYNKVDKFFASVLAGRTCDSIDIIAEDIQLPVMEVGDILIGKQMGAYTIASATEFNGYPKPKIIVINGSEL